MICIEHNRNHSRFRRDSPDFLTRSHSILSPLSSFHAMFTNYNEMIHHYEHKTVIIPTRFLVIHYSTAHTELSCLSYQLVSSISLSLFILTQSLLPPLSIARPSFQYMTSRDKSELDTLHTWRDNFLRQRYLLIKCTTLFLHSNTKHRRACIYRSVA